MMKQLLAFFIFLSFFSCGQGKLQDLFIESNDLPYKVDSLFFSSFNKSNFKELTIDDLKILKENLYKGEDDITLIDELIETDSLVKAGKEIGRRDDLQWSPDYTQLYALNRIKLTAEIEAFTWYVSIGDGNQKAEHVFVTFFKNNNAYSCFHIGMSDFYSDSPVWSEQLLYGQITREGQILLDKFITTGQYNNEGEDELLSSGHRKYEYTWTNGDIKYVKDELVSEYEQENDYLPKGIPVDDDMMAKLGDLFAEKALPLKVDSSFISEVPEGDYQKLNSEIVSVLSENLEDIADMYSTGSVKAFLKIDSLKQYKKYEKYVESLSGDIENSYAYAISVCEFEDGTFVYLWAINDWTQESGPWSHGTIFLASFIKDNMMMKCHPVAQLDEAGDAPLYSFTKVECQISPNSEITISYYRNDMDESPEGVQTSEKTSNTFNYNWEDGQLIELTETE